MTMLPPGRSCILNPDKPVDYVDDFDLGDTDDTVPEEAAIILSGRPLKERFYGPKMWLKKYKVSDGSLYAKSRPMVSHQVLILILIQFLREECTHLLHTLH